MEMSVLTSEEPYSVSETDGVNCGVENCELDVPCKY